MHTYSILYITFVYIQVCRSYLNLFTFFGNIFSYHICFELNLQEEHLHFHMVCNTFKKKNSCCHLFPYFTALHLSYIYFKPSSQFDVCHIHTLECYTIQLCWIVAIARKSCRLSPVKGKDKKNCLIQFLQILCVLSKFEITQIRENVTIDLKKKKDSVHL